MADNVDLANPTGTAAADDVGGALYQIIKLALGADGVANLLAVGSGSIDTGTPRVCLATNSPGVTAAGQTTKSASLPVTLASDGEGLGAVSVFRSLDLDETEEDVKTSPGHLFKLRITNFATTTRYVKLYNAAAADVAVGTTTPIDTIPIPGSSSGPIVLTESFGGMGLSFSTALSMAATTGLADNDTGAPSANDVVVTAYYK